MELIKKIYDVIRVWGSFVFLLSYPQWPFILRGAVPSQVGHFTFICAFAFPVGRRRDVERRGDTDIRN